MADPNYIRSVLGAGLSLLPLPMRSREARALLAAIGWQESRWSYRRQHGGGPARGFFQFELATAGAVMDHPATRAHARSALRAASLSWLMDQPAQLHEAFSLCDPLAVVWARLLLWTLPDPLPAHRDRVGAWEQYLKLWRPGRPRPNTWWDAWRFGWTLILEEDINDGSEPESRGARAGAGILSLGSLAPSERSGRHRGRVASRGRRRSRRA